MRNGVARADKQSRRVVVALIGTAFAQDGADAARGQWRQIVNHLRPHAKKFADLMDQTGADVLAYTSFPPAHRRKLQSTKPIERGNGEVTRCTAVIGIFPTTTL